jgi:hypothetical protein
MPTRFTWYKLALAFLFGYYITGQSCQELKKAYKLEGLIQNCCILRTNDQTSDQKMWD